MKKKLSLLMALSMGICSISSLSMTASAESLDEVKVEVRVYDSVTNETVENVNVKLCTFDTVNMKVYEEWNTSDSNPHKVDIIRDSTIDEDGDGLFGWQIEIDEIPDGYSYKGHNYLDGYNISRTAEDGTLIYELPFDPVPSVEDIVFPVQDTIKYSFNLKDKTTGNFIEDVKVKFYKISEYNEIDTEKDLIAEWTYKQGDVIEVPVYIENEYASSNYKLAFEGLPENYVVDHYYTSDKHEYIYINAYDYIKAKYSDEMPGINCAVIDEELITRSTVPSFNTLLRGDANCDNDVNIADATAIMQYIGNKDKYPLSEQGLENADCYNTGDGVTGMDAITIQQLEARIIDRLPE